LRDIATLKSKGRTRSGRINPSPISKKVFNKKDRHKRKQETPATKESKTAGIDEAGIQRRKIEGECLRCAWPSDRKGAHRVKDCLRPIKLETGTACYPKAKEYQQLKLGHQLPSVEDDSSDKISLEESSNDSL
jgi:hypothetical protein